jgi:pentatricopeptide repeat protein
VIDGCSKKREIDFALKLNNEMIEKGIKLNEMVYTTLVNDKYKSTIVLNRNTICHSIKHKYKKHIINTHELPLIHHMRRHIRSQTSLKNLVGLIPVML